MAPSTTQVVAGVIGGLAGTLAMNYAQRLWTLVADRRAPESAAGAHDARDWQERTEDQNANEIAAQTVALATIDRPLSRRELSIAAPVVHFTFGAVVGALYGAFRNRLPRGVRSGGAFGATVWFAADEIAMPLLGLDSTRRRPLEMHLQSFTSHLVYGIVAARVQRLTQLVLESPVRASRGGPSWSKAAWGGRFTTSSLKTRRSI